MDNINKALSTGETKQSLPISSSPSYNKSTLTNPIPYHNQQHVTYKQQSFLGSLITYATLGVGMTLGMVAVKAIFGF